MNTMADGARERLVEQIGEALFGQPGLTLMELAEKVKGMRSPFLIEEEPLPADMRLGSVDYLDYLSDQPSPACLDAHELWAMAQLAPGEGIEDGVRRIEAAIAARQPVGVPLWCLHVLGMDDVHPAPSKAHAEKAAAWHNEQFKDQAARLGISIEAKVVPWPHSAESHAAGVAEFIPQWLIPQWQLDALEAKADQPAQAVDLGAVRALLQRRIEQWRSHLPADPGAPGTREVETKGEHDYNNDVAIYRQGIAVMEEVLFKIDSQAVGNK